MIIYGRSDHINKQLIKYKVKKIKYTETSKTGSTFKELIHNFFFNYENLNDSYKRVSDNSKAFWEYYNNIFSNILTILSVIDFDHQYMDSFSNDLIAYLEKENILRGISYNSVNTFFRRVGAKLRTKTLERYFNLLLNNARYHEETYFLGFLRILHNRKERIEMNDSQFESIVNLAFEECNICSRHHQNTIITPIYLIIKNEIFKESIRSRIDTILAETFNFNLYYSASIHGVIEFNEDLLNKAIDYSMPKKNQKSFKSFMSGEKEMRFDAVNEVANLCFKYDYKVEKSIYEKYKSLDIYYKWLFDMDGFDYKHFEPIWITEYNTRFYNRAIGRNSKVQKAVRKYLEKNSNSEIEKFYMNIFVIKRWKGDKE